MLLIPASYIAEGYVSITPLQLDLTAYSALPSLDNWKWDIQDLAEGTPWYALEGAKITAGISSVDRSYYPPIWLVIF